MCNVAYLRVSTAKQDVERQELEIRRYSENLGIGIDEWLRVTVSSRKSSADRRVDELLDRLQPGDALIVAELSLLGRSLSQVVLTIDALREKRVGFQSIKEGMYLNGSRDMTAKIQVAMFGVLAEIERDLISERTKAGLAAARNKGKRLGRPKGSLGASKLDGVQSLIEELLGKGITQRALARHLGVAPSTLRRFIYSRGLVV